MASIDFDGVPLLLPTKSVPPPTNNAQPTRPSFSDFLRAFYPLPFVAFGGPHACVALLYDTFVRARTQENDDTRPQPRVSESRFLELYALAQSLPGPNSTKLVALLGATFGGLRGAAATTALWLLPGFAAMSIAGAWFHVHLHDATSTATIHELSGYAFGLVAAAFAFVLIAAFRLVSKIIANDPCRAAIANASLALAVLVPPRAMSWICVVSLAGGGVVYLISVSLRPPTPSDVSEVSQESDDDELCATADTTVCKADMADLDIPISRWEGVSLLSTVVVLTMIIFSVPGNGTTLRLTRTFWRIGVCVYGGALVMVPLLLTEFVQSGLLPANVFLAAFGLFGCVPGPMVNLVAFLGAAVFGWRGAIFGALAVNSPGIMLQLGLVPFWARVRKFECARIFLQGTNSAAAGLIVAGVWMLIDRALTGPAAFVLTVSAGSMALIFEVPMPAIVVLHGIAGVILQYFGIGIKARGR